MLVNFKDESCCGFATYGSDGSRCNGLGFEQALSSRAPPAEHFLSFKNSFALTF